MGKCSFTIDRTESRHDTPAATRSAVAKWEGGTVVLNTIVMKKTGGQHTEMVGRLIEGRWKQVVTGCY